MIEIKRDEKGPVATYTVTIADEIGDPKPLPLYVAPGIAQDVPPKDGWGLAQFGNPPLPVLVFRQ